jgi:hypothetical protein
MRAVELWRYPVKSFLGERLDHLELDARGVVGDRWYAVTDANGKFGSGKTTRRFRLLRDLFAFSAETVDGQTLVRIPGGASYGVGDPELDALLSERYGEPLRLAAEADVPHFDAGPVHVLTTSSLRWIEERLGESAGAARRYRPNVVLETDQEGLVEQGWEGAMIELGTSVLRVNGPVERCVMANSAQAELPYDARVLRLLVAENETLLGMYADVVQPGTIRAGDTAVVTPR